MDALQRDGRVQEERGDGMKCDKCFFCTHVGKGIYADYPVKFCKLRKQYFMPFVEENGEKRKLDFGNMKDCKLWHGTGCNIHPKTVEKAKQEFLNSLEKVVMEGEVTE